MTDVYNPNIYEKVDKKTNKPKIKKNRDQFNFNQLH